MPSPCLNCVLGRLNKNNDTCYNCQKRIDRVREIHIKYSTGPITNNLTSKSVINEYLIYDRIKQYGVG